MAILVDVGRFRKLEEMKLFKEKGGLKYDFLKFCVVGCLVDPGQVEGEGVVAVEGHSALVAGVEPPRPCPPTNQTDQSTEGTVSLLH